MYPVSKGCPWKSNTSFSILTRNNEIPDKQRSSFSLCYFSFTATWWETNKKVVLNQFDQPSFGGTVPSGAQRGKCKQVLFDQVLHLNPPPLVAALGPAAAGEAVRRSFLGLRQRPSAVLLRPPLALVPPQRHVAALVGLQRAVHLPDTERDNVNTRIHVQVLSFAPLFFFTIFNISVKATVANATMATSSITSIYYIWNSMRGWRLAIPKKTLRRKR